MASTVTSAPVRLPRPERREQIIRAAAHAFLAGGFGGTSMEQVADAAGVTRLIVYRVFASKAALYRAVLSSVTGQLQAELTRRGGPSDPSVPPAMAGVVLGVARAHPDAFRLLWRHARHERPFAAEAATFRRIAADITDSIIASRVTITDATFRHWCATAVVDHLYEGICCWLDHGDPGRDDEFAARQQAGLRALVTAWSSM